MSIIKDVKVLGSQSVKSGRIYSKEALEQLAKMLDGVPVHIGCSSKPRKVEDRVGKCLGNGRLDEKGDVVCDIELFPRFQADENLLDKGRLAFNGFGEVNIKDGIEEVTEISNVRSIDIVSKDT